MPMKLSIVIPLHNEEECVTRVFDDIEKVLEKEHIPREYVLVNDHSTDQTLPIIENLARKYSTVKVVSNDMPNGFGRAIRKGLDSFSGDAVTIVMGDGSDDPRDIVAYYRKLEEGYDCVFGSRFTKGSQTIDYPSLKLFFNRLGNFFIKFLFGIRYNDVSNAFKAYKRNVIEAVKPLVSNHFNITVEIPLKAIIRGYRYAVIPINWYGRTSGVSKHKLFELQRKYFFSIFYVWLEKILLGKEVTGSIRGAKSQKGTL